MSEHVQMVGDPENPLRLITDPANAEDNRVLSFFLNYWRDHRANDLPPTATFKPTEVRGHLWRLPCHPALTPLQKQSAYLRLE